MNNKHISRDLQRNLRQTQRIYREPIEIQKKTDSVQKEDGTWTKGKWQTWKKVFANISNLYGSEFFSAGQIGKESTVKFYIRYMTGLDNQVKEDFRILYKGDLYNIDFIDNINYLNEELEIKAIERRITSASD